MSRVLQVRGLPDDVHDALRREAAARGQSLTRFVVTELEQVAERTAVTRANVAEVRRIQAAVGAQTTRVDILAAIQEGRGE